MSTQKHSLFESVLARISLGAVPVDGVFWFDPRGGRKGRQEASRTQEQPGTADAAPGTGKDGPSPLDPWPCS